MSDSITKVIFLPTFLTPESVTIKVAVGTSLQEAAELAGVPMGDACGGNCACSTCHVHILEGFDNLDEMDDDEDDILGKAEDVQFMSRLGCQVELPSGQFLVKITRESQEAYTNEHPEYRDRANTIIP